MKRRVIAGINRLLSWLIALLLLMGVAAAVPAYAEENTTTTDPEILDLDPGTKVSEDGYVTLHKYGKRTGPDEWTVTVKATIGEKPIEKRKMEVVMLMDLSSSMRTNEVEDHKHTDACKVLKCTVHTEHNDDCYGDLNCTQPVHEHKYVSANSSNDCYDRCTNKQHNNDNKHTRAGCVEFDDRWYTVSCGNEEHVHSVANGCYEITCTKTLVTNHVHGLGCYECPYYGFKDVANPNNYGNNENEYILNGYATRLAIAAVAAERLLSSLPADSTDITRLGFNTQNAKLITGISSYYDVGTNTGTHLWQAINLVLSGDYFSDDPNTKKIFVILNDGNANDSQTTATKNLLDEFKKTGTIFTVGFAQADSMLGQIAGGDGGKYMMATNASQLISVFDELSQKLTAMLVDPMGTTVGFTQNSIVEGSGSADGEIIWVEGDNTIYWNPEEGTNGSVAANSTITYSYIVTLNKEANLTVGTHHNVELNNTTNFIYGTTDSAQVTESFLIPRATYKLSSIQTSWVDEKGKPIPVAGYNATIKSDPIICDYSDEKYHPEFDSKYTTVTEKILLEDGSYYLYTGSTVEAVQYTTWHDSNEEPDGADVTKKETVATSLGAIDPSKPYHYTVVHNYKLVKADTLILTATKEMVGRNFLEDEEYEFVLSAAEGTPMPGGAVTKDGVTKATVTIKPTTGGTYTFVFPDIVYSKVGEYTYTVSEVRGTLDDVIYDPTEHTVKVVVTENAAGNGFVATCTLDRPLVFTNRLVPGNLKVEKTGVRHYNSNDGALETLAFPFGIQVNDMSGRPMTGTYTAMKTNTKGEVATTVTFDAGYAAVTLQARESIEIVGLPMGATYTVAEYAPSGFIATATGATGTIAANKTVTASFENAYHAEGKYQFRATKVLKNANGNDLELAWGQFTFRVLDEQGNVVSTVTNNADGSIFFHTLPFTEADMAGINEDGEVKKKYTIVEVAGSDASILYDGTEYNVTLTIVDKGNGTLTVTDDLGTDGKITFTNTKISNQLVVSKTVAGNLGSRNREFDFTLDLGTANANATVKISTDGVNFTSTTLDANGQTTFTLKHGESISIYPVDGLYTVAETDAGSYTTTYSINQAEAITGTTASGTVEENGTHVAFVNTLEATVPTGIHTPAASALIGICLAGALIAIALIGRRGVCYES